MGKIPGDGQGRSHRGKADPVGSGAKEDRRCAKSAMGEGGGSTLPNHADVLISNPVLYASVNGELAATGRSVSLVSKPLVHDIQEIFSTPESFKLRNEESHRVIEPVRRVIGAVWGQKDIFE
jgi:hypothetical protein